MEGDAKNTIAAYREAGVHRLIHILQNPPPNTWEKQVDDIAHAWL